MTTNVTFADEAGTPVPDDFVPSTPAETREDYLALAKSGAAKIRHALIQVAGNSTRPSSPGVLHRLNRNHRAAVLYLALLTNWPWLDREEDPLASGAWLRFLECDPPADPDAPKPLTWTAQTLSRAWSVLEQEKLVARPKKGRLVNIRPLLEDGSGGAYTRPKGEADGGLYFGLPDAFWTEQLHGTLTWPALMVLLILLKETGGKGSAELRVDRAQKYYGISRSTAEKGLAELRELGLLSSSDQWMKDSMTGEGKRLASLHTLLGEFSTDRRAEVREAAAKRMKKRQPKPAEGGDDDGPASTAPSS